MWVASLTRLIAMVPYCALSGQQDPSLNAISSPQRFHCLPSWPGRGKRKRKQPKKQGAGIGHAKGRKPSYSRKQYESAQAMLGTSATSLGLHGVQDQG
jgi:hypothetical protein